MFKFRAAARVAASLVVCMAAAVAWSQDGKKPEGMPAMPSPEEMKQMQERMEAAMKAGPQHEALRKTVGTWNVSVKMWWGGPAMPPMSTSGVAELKAVLDGKFVLEEISYDMMMPGADGQVSKAPFKGMSLTGYDNFRNMYVVNWADSMGTGMIRMYGMQPPGSNTITFYGEMDEPAMGVVGRTVKGVNRIISDDKFTFELYDLHAGDDYKVIEMTYERRK